MTVKKEVLITNHLQVEFREHYKKMMPNLKNQDLLVLWLFLVQDLVYFDWMGFS